MYLCVLCLFVTTALTAQKYSTKTGQISFEASVPSFEEVKAKNENVSAILNMDTGDFASLALMNGFRFKVALMEEHFNENYVESAKYPKTTFRGKIQGFNPSELSETEKEYTVSGTITMHGESKSIEAPIRIKKEGETIMITTDFVLQPGDFNIKIPKIVSKKIADDVNVSATYSLSN